MGWISVRVCSKSDGIVFQFNSFYLIIIIAAVLVSLCCTRTRGGHLPMAPLGGAREGGLVLAVGVLLVILDLAAKLAALAGDMPAVLVDVSRTVRPRVLAVDLRRACVSVDGKDRSTRTLAQTYLERFLRLGVIMLVQLNLIRPRQIVVAAEALAGARLLALENGFRNRTLGHDVDPCVIWARRVEGVLKRHIPRGGHVGVRGAGHKEGESSDGELHPCWCWCWLLERRRGDAAC